MGKPSFGRFLARTRHRQSNVVPSREKLSRSEVQAAMPLRTSARFWSASAAEALRFPHPHRCRRRVGRNLSNSTLRGALAAARGTPAKLA